MGHDLKLYFNGEFVHNSGFSLSCVLGWMALSPFQLEFVELLER